MSITLFHIAKSHGYQYYGMDFQLAAQDVAHEYDLHPCDDGDIQLLESSPDESCDCSFCSTVDWYDEHGRDNENK